MKRESNESQPYCDKEPAMHFVDQTSSKYHASQRSLNTQSNHPEVQHASHVPVTAAFDNEHPAPRVFVKPEAVQIYKTFNAQDSSDSNALIEYEQIQMRAIELAQE